MPRFDPTPGEKFVLSGEPYRVTEHPGAPSMAYAQEGRKAFVYQTVDKNGKFFALKVFKHSYRIPSLVQACASLKDLVMPGLEVCDRMCLDKSTAPDLITKYPDLEYAVLMPWIEGCTWFELMLSKSSLSKQNSLTIAHNIACVLAKLEENDYAHCDVSGANVIVNPKSGKINFIDIEDMFGEGMPSPYVFPKGTDGYQHREVRSHKFGQWRIDGDRFSTAILLGEILCWHDESLRKVRHGEHFFGVKELQDDNSPRYMSLINGLNDISPEVAELFQKAWKSKSLSDCPKLEEWSSVLGPLVSETWKPITLPPFQMPLSIIAYRQNEVSGESKIDQRLLGRPQIYPLVSVRINQKILLRWTAAKDSYQYELQCADGEKAVQEYDFQTIYLGAQPFFEVSYENHGVKFYRVRSRTETETGIWSPVERLYIFPERRPTTPVLHPVYNILGDRSYSVSWTKVVDAQWYELEEMTGKWPFINWQYIYIDGSKQIKDTRVLLAGKKEGLYAYRIRAYNYCGYSDYSAQITVKVKSMLSASQAKFIRVDNHHGLSDYSIHWESVPGVSGYILFEGAKQDLETATKIYQGRENKFLIINKEPGVYYYAVAIYDTRGTYDPQFISDWVNTEVVLQRPTWHLPSQSYELIANEEGNVAIQLIWTMVKGANKYSLAWKDEMGKQRIDMIDSNSCSLSRPEGLYEFQVNSVSNKGVSSSWSFPVRVTIKRKDELVYQVFFETEVKR